MHSKIQRLNAFCWALWCLSHKCLHNKTTAASSLDISWSHLFKYIPVFHLSWMWCFTRRCQQLYCTVLFVLFLGFPQCLFSIQASWCVCIVVLVVYNNIPVPDFTHSYVKCYLKIIIWKCYLMRVLECVVTVNVSVCVYISLPATVQWCIPFLSVRFDAAGSHQISSGSIWFQGACFPSV